MEKYRSTRASDRSSCRAKNELYDSSSIIVERSVRGAAFMHYLLVALLVILMSPSAAFAEAPGSVTGIAAKVQGGEVLVSWNANKETDVAYYNVYYSTQSIIQNAGLYDDFESTDGPVTQHTLSVPYRTGKLFVSVLAVNEEGEESIYFHDDVSVDLVQNAAGEAVTVSPGQELPPGYSLTPPKTFASDGMMHLMSAEATSPTTVVLRFSNPVVITAEAAPLAFRILDPAGNMLPIKSMIVDQEVATVETVNQQRGVTYQVQVNEPLSGKPDLTLSPTDRSALFVGHAQAGDTPSPFVQGPTSQVPGYAPQPPVGSQSQVPGFPSQQPPQQQQVQQPQIPGLPEQPQGCPRDPMNPPGVTNFTLEPKLSESGHYEVIARWAADNRCEDLIGFMVVQTRDQGRSFGEPSILPINIAGVKLSGVNPGEFGIAIYTINMYGFPSQGGAFQNVTLPFYGGFNPITYPFQGAISLETLPLEEDITMEIIAEGESDVFPVEIAEPEVPVAELHAAAPVAPVQESRIDPVRLGIVTAGGAVIILVIVLFTVSAKKMVNNITNS